MILRSFYSFRTNVIISFVPLLRQILVSPALSNDGHFEFLTVIKSIPVIGRVPNGVRFVPIISSLIH